jgi:branched-subunit amino acid aminotransferase/4-amino-4-deoxychorismate lyase
MEVIPVVEIDGNSVSSGIPGEVTRRIHHLYRRLVADESL